MESQLKVNLSSRILETVIRWSPITIYDLKKVITEQSNKDSITRLTNLLVKNGYLQSEHTPLIKSKILYPTKLLIDQTGSLNKEHKGQYLVHNTLLTGFCIDILNLANVDEVFLEKDLNGFERVTGDLSPDAEAIVYPENLPIKVAIEFEYTQKAKNRILTKIDKFMRGSYYQKMIFILKNEREASVYVNYYVEYLNTANFKISKEDSERVIFVYKTEKNRILNFSDLFTVMFPHEVNSLDLFFGKALINNSDNNPEVKNV